MNTWPISLLLLVTIAVAKDMRHRQIPRPKVRPEPKQPASAATSPIAALVKSAPARANQLINNASSSKASLHSKIPDRIKRDLDFPTALEGSSLETARTKRCHDGQSSLQSQNTALLARVAKRKASVEKLLQKRVKKLNSMEEGLEETLVQKLLEKLGDEPSLEDYSSMPYQYNLLNSQERPYKRSIPTVTEAPKLHRATRTTQPPSGFHTSSRLRGSRDSLASPHRRFDTLKEYLQFVQEQHQKAHDNFQNRLKAPSQVIRTEIPAPVEPPQNYYDGSNSNYGYQSGQYLSQNNALGGNIPSHAHEVLQSPTEEANMRNPPVWPYPKAESVSSLHYEKDALVSPIAHESLQPQQLPSQQHVPDSLPVSSAHTQPGLSPYQYSGTIPYAGRMVNTTSNLALNWQDVTHYQANPGAVQSTHQEPLVQPIETNNLPYESAVSTIPIHSQGAGSYQQGPQLSGYEGTHYSQQRKSQLPDRKTSTLQISKLSSEGLKGPGDGFSRTIGISSGRGSSQQDLHGTVSRLNHDGSNSIDGTVANSATAHSSKIDQGHQASSLIMSHTHDMIENHTPLPVTHIVGSESQHTHQEGLVKESPPSTLHQVHHASIPNLQLALPEPNPYEDSPLPVLQQPIPPTTPAPSVHQLPLLPGQHFHQVFQAENSAGARHQALTAQLPQGTENNHQLTQTRGPSVHQDLTVNHQSLNSQLVQHPEGTESVNHEPSQHLDFTHHNPQELRSNHELLAAQLPQGTDNMNHQPSHQLSSSSHSAHPDLMLNQQSLNTQLQQGAENSNHQPTYQLSSSSNHQESENMNHQSTHQLSSDAFTNHQELRTSNPQPPHEAENMNHQQTSSTYSNHQQIRLSQQPLTPQLPELPEETETVNHEPVQSMATAHTLHHELMLNKQSLNPQPPQDAENMNQQKTPQLASTYRNQHEIKLSQQPPQLQNLLQGVENVNHEPNHQTPSSHSVYHQVSQSLNPKHLQGAENINQQPNHQLAQPTPRTHHELLLSQQSVNPHHSELRELTENANQPSTHQLAHLTQEQSRQEESNSPLSPVSIAHNQPGGSLNTQATQNNVAESLAHHLQEPANLHIQTKNHEGTNYNLQTPAENHTPAGLTHHISQEPPKFHIPTVDHGSSLTSNQQSQIGNQREHQTFSIQSLANSQQHFTQDRTHFTGSEKPMIVNPHFPTHELEMFSSTKEKANSAQGIKELQLKQATGNIHHQTIQDHLSHQTQRLFDVKSADHQQDQNPPNILSTPLHVNQENLSSNLRSADNNKEFHSAVHQGLSTSLSMENHEQPKKLPTFSFNNDHLGSHHHLPLHSEPEPRIVNPKFMYRTDSTAAETTQKLHNTHPEIPHNLEKISQNFPFSHQQKHIQPASLTQENHDRIAVHNHGTPKSSIADQEALDSAAHKLHSASRDENPPSQHYFHKHNVEPMIVNPKFMHNNHNVPEGQTNYPQSTSQTKLLENHLSASNEKFSLDKNPNHAGSAFTSQQINNEPSSQTRTTYQSPHSGQGIVARVKSESNDDDSGRLFDKVVSELKAMQNKEINERIQEKGIISESLKTSPTSSFNPHVLNEPNSKNLNIGETARHFHSQNPEWNNFEKTMSQKINLREHQVNFPTQTEPSISTIHSKSTQNTGKPGQYHGLEIHTPVAQERAMNIYTGEHTSQARQQPNEMTLQQQTNQPSANMQPVLENPTGEISNPAEKHNHHYHTKFSGQNTGHHTAQTNKMQTGQDSFVKNQMTQTNPQINQNQERQQIDNEQYPRNPQQNVLKLTPESLKQNQEHGNTLPSLPEAVLEAQLKQEEPSFSSKIIHVGFGGGHSRSLYEHATTTSPKLPPSPPTTPPHTDHQIESMRTELSNYEANQYSASQLPQVNRKFVEEARNRDYLTPTVKKWPAEPLDVIAHQQQVTQDHSVIPTANFDVHGTYHPDQKADIKPAINSELYSEIGKNSKFPSAATEQASVSNQGLPALPAAYLEQLPPVKYDFLHHDNEKNEATVQHQDHFIGKEKRPRERQRVMVTPRPIELQRKPIAIERNYPEIESNENLNENATVPYRLVVEGSGEEEKSKAVEKGNPSQKNFKAAQMPNAGKSLDWEKYQRPTWGRNDKKLTEFKQRLPFNRASQSNNNTSVVTKAKLDTFYNDDLAKSAPDTESNDDDDEYESGEDEEDDEKQNPNGRSPVNPSFILPFLNKQSSQISQKNTLQSVGPNEKTFSLKGFELPKRPSYTSRKGKYSSRKKDISENVQPVTVDDYETGSGKIDPEELSSGKDKRAGSRLFATPSHPHVEGMDTEHAKMLLKQLEQEWNEGMSKIMNEVTGPHNKPKKVEEKFVPSKHKVVPPTIEDKPPPKVDSHAQLPFKVITSEEGQPQEKFPDKKFPELSLARHHTDEKRSCSCSEIANEINSHEDRTDTLPTFIVGQPSHGNDEIQGLDDLKSRVEAARRGRIGHKADGAEMAANRITEDAKFEKHTICGCGRHHESSHEVAVSKKAHTTCGCGCQDDVVRSVNDKPELNKYDIMHNMLLWMKHYVPKEPLPQ